MPEFSQDITVDLNVELTNNVLNSLHVNQYEHKSREINIYVKKDGADYPIPNDLTVNIRIHKSNGYDIYKTIGKDIGTISGNIITILVEESMTIASGRQACDIEFIDTNGNRLYSTKFYLNVHKSALDDNNIKDTDDYSTVQSLARESKEYANLSESYAVGTDNEIRENDSTDNAKYYKEQAELNADNALEYSENAQNYSVSASNSAESASTSAENALKSEIESKKSEQNAKASENAATTAKNQAEQAAQQATSIAEGGLRFAGSIPFSSVPTSGMTAGTMYNITDNFTTDSRFEEGAGHTYPEGTNIAYTVNNKWDCFAGENMTIIKKTKNNIPCFGTSCNVINANNKGFTMSFIDRSSGFTQNGGDYESGETIPNLQGITNSCIMGPDIRIFNHDGYNTNYNLNHIVVVGYGSRTSGYGGETNIGGQNQIYNDHATVLGYGNITYGSYDVVIGSMNHGYTYYNRNDSRCNIIIGSWINNNESIHYPIHDTIAIGNGRTSTMVQANYDISIGSGAKTGGCNETNTQDGTNIAIGIDANCNYNNSSQYSIAIGHGATCKTGNSIVIGSGASTGTETGNNSCNVIIGNHAANKGAYIAPVVIGNHAEGYNDRCVVIGENGRSTGNHSISIGANAGYNIGVDAKTATAAIQVGYESLAYGGSYPIAIGYSARASSAFTTALGYDAIVSGSNSTSIGWGAHVTDSNSIQLGHNLYTSMLRCKVALSVTSDERDKTDFQAIDNSLQFINKLEPFTYVYNMRDAYHKEELTEEEEEIYYKYGYRPYDREAHRRGDKKGTRRRTGLSAQKTIKALEEVYGSSDVANIVSDNFYDRYEDDIPDGIENQYTMQYENLIPFLIQAIQELSQENNELKLRIDKLETVAV